MTSAPAPSHDRPTLRKLMLAGLIGSSIEWYDFFIYGTAAALVFGKVFFPDSSPLIGTLLAFSTFWAGFVARPLGGLVFGYIGDRIGRKPAVLMCLIMVTAGTFLIGCLPSAETIGVAAPILLVVLRFIQGIAVGGQWGGVILLLTESVMPGQRGRSGTFGQMGVPGGLLLGTLAFLAAGALVPSDQFLTWGWRLPFWASAALMPVVFFIHKKVEETPAFRELQHSAEGSHSAIEQAPLREVVTSQWRRIGIGSAVIFASNTIFYISIAGLLDYGTRELGLEREALLEVGLLSSLAGMIVIYLAGRASDRLGRRPLMIAGAAGMSLWAIPYFLLVDTASLWWIFVATTVGGVFSALVYGPYAAFLGELFPARVRYSGMSIAYQIAAILISGGTPFVMTALLATFGSSMAVAAYLLVVALVSLLAAVHAPETHPVRAASAATPVAAKG